MAERAWPKHFKDRLTSPLPRGGQIWRIIREGGFANKHANRDAPKIPRLPAPLPPPSLNPGQGSVTWVGHASFIVRIAGLTILTDPVWSERLPGRARRMVPPGVPWDALGKVDAVVISHNHYDHLDARTVLRLPKETPFFVPGGLATWFHMRGFTAVTELDWWESAELRGVKFDFVPSHHWSRRGLADVCRSLWGGWVITASDGRRVYFAGDTGYGGWFTQIGARYPGIEVAMLPIGAYAPRWFMKPVHIDPDEAILALNDLGAKKLACMHWGTFVLTQEPIMEPLERVRVAWKASGRKPSDLWDLAVGESRVF